MPITYGSVCSGIEAALVQRFMTKFAKGLGDACWEWQAAKTSRGYGKIGAGGKRGKTLLAHRLSYRIHLGEIPEGLQVCHKCDNRACVNPDHLFLGTNSDNVQDMISKGRFVSYDMNGEKNPSAKLSAQQAETIKLRLKSGECRRKIAADFGVSYSLIGEIARGKLWATSPTDPSVQE